ncbi:MAG: nuclear transport factor 2 family protein [Acidobacteriota bacterium]
MVTVDARALLVQERELLSAMRSRDLPTLSRLLAREYVFTSGDGEVWGREHALSDFTRVDFCLTKLDVEVDRIILLRGGAVVTGRSEVDGKVGGRSISGCYRFTRVWKRTGRRWVIVATHTSRSTRSSRTEKRPRKG